MDHLIYCFLIVFTEINDTRSSLSELVAASTVEEPASRADNGSVYSPLSVVARDSEVGIFAA